MKTSEASTHDQLITIDELAAWLRKTKRTIYNWRSTRTGPQGFRIANGAVLYRRSVVEKWIEDQEAIEAGARQ